MRHITLIGHISLDRIELNKQSYFPILGGAVVYASVIFRKFNYDVTIISEVGKDFPKPFWDFFESIGINTEFISKTSPHTTSYYLRYNNKSFRDLFLVKKALPIKVNKIDSLKYLVDQSCAIAILPIINEIPVEFFKLLTSYKKKLLIGIDIQGFLRKEINGAIQIQKLDKITLNNIKSINPTFVKASYEEARYIFPKLRIRELAKIMKSETNSDGLILSLGEYGTLGVYKEKVHLTPVRKKIKSPKNTTGAGDVLFSSFIGFFLQGFNFKFSLNKATEIASNSIMFMDPIEIYEKLEIAIN